MRRGFFALFTALLWLGATLLAAELTLALFSSSRLSGIVHDTRLGWRFQSDYQHRSTTKEGKPRVISYNQHGFRDRDHLPQKPGGITRILFLGDSYTAGVHVNDDETFVRKFEMLLNENEAGRYEVMSGAVSAWATDQQYLYLRDEGLQFQPDFIILMIAPNDIRETFAKGFFQIENGELVERSVPEVPPLRRFAWYLANTSRTFEYIQNRLGWQFGHFRDIFEYFPITFPTATGRCTDKMLFLASHPLEVEKAFSLFETLILEIYKLCEREDLGLLLSVIPTEMEVDGTLAGAEYRPGKVVTFVQRVSDSMGMPYLNLHRKLQESGISPKTIYLDDDFHFNVSGHTFMAGALFDLFRKHLDEFNATRRSLNKNS